MLKSHSQHSIQPQLYISPIAIDLGATHNGVYLAHYPAGAVLQDIQKSGHVYHLDRTNYTLLMTDRSAARHQRRAYNRRAMAKRLLRLIWIYRLGLEWSDNIQKSISFLLNRRGFNFIREQYDQTILAHFPHDAYVELPAELQQVPRGANGYNFATAIQMWAQSDGIIAAKIQAIEDRIYLEKLRHACQQKRATGHYIEYSNSSNKLQHLNMAIFERLKQLGIQGLDAAETETHLCRMKGGEVKALPYVYGDTINLQAYIDQSGREEEIWQSLPENHTASEYTWNFNLAHFTIDENHRKKCVEPPPPPEDAAAQDWQAWHKKRAMWIRYHVHHLAYALHSVYIELQSGHRYRSRYFEEIQAALKTLIHRHAYMADFCRRLRRGLFDGLTSQRMANLIGHVSNLTLKPLRKYFNDQRHHQGDFWDETRLATLFENWILNEWRIDEHDSIKKSGNWNYATLRKMWHNHRRTTKTVVDFWLQTNPRYTIPSHNVCNNRRPPRCQNLILNVKFLSHTYPKWRAWLRQLCSIKETREYLAGYQDTLMDLRSSKGRPYFDGSQKEIDNAKMNALGIPDLDARLLQYIFDRDPTHDPLRLNAIYRHTKKLGRLKRAGKLESKVGKDTYNALQTSLRESTLPAILIGNLDWHQEHIYTPATFLHLVCQYYKMRQRANQGRIFIHPHYRVTKRGFKNSGQFNDATCLLTFCNHKSRQKRYQILHDMAALLQVSPKKLQQAVCKREGEEIDDEKLTAWAQSIRGIRVVCERAAQVQRERGDLLKSEIQRLTHSPSEDEELYALSVSARNLYLEMVKKDGLYDANRIESRTRSLEHNPAAALYILAQIHNMLFRERSGNAKTCPVCSADNAMRMAVITDGGIRARRLPTIVTRIIDGAVMRMARIVSHAILEDKWAQIKNDVQRGHEVRIPIIIESNTFEFKPNLQQLKGHARDDIEPTATLIDERKERIKTASAGICPYTGQQIYNRGVIDHIIPHTSMYGTLNDESNLIWVSFEGRKQKGRQFYSLADLADNYKEVQFGTLNNGQIAEQIIEHIGDGEGGEFLFGRYQHFVNLTPLQQRCFRHALFLEGYPVREQVLQAINYHHRVAVNGTQRYFASVLANTIHRRALAHGWEKRISFDYFGVSADVTQRDSITAIRWYLQGKKQARGGYQYPELYRHRKYEKRGEKWVAVPQEAYSHIIDAQLAFMRTLSTHYREGSLRINQPWIGLLEYADQQGELHDLYSAIRIPERSCIQQSLTRKLSANGTRFHRPFHLPNPQALRLLPLFIGEEEGKIVCKRGFAWHDNAITINARYVSDVIACIPLVSCEELIARKEHITTLADVHAVLRNIFGARQWYYINWSRTKVCAYLIEHLSNGALADKGRWQWEGHIRFFITHFVYQTKRHPIPLEIEGVSQILAQEKYFKLRGDIWLPVKRQWQQLHDDWRAAGQIEPLAFLTQHPIFKRQEPAIPHEKRARHFSLPVIDTQGRHLIRRRSWNMHAIYQLLPSGDSRQDVNKFSRLVLSDKGEIGETPNHPFRSYRQFKLPEPQRLLFSTLHNIDPNVWWEINVSLPGVRKLEYKIDSVSYPKIRLTPKRNITPHDRRQLAVHELTKPRPNAQRSGEHKIMNATQTFEYAGYNFSKGIVKALHKRLRANNTQRATQKSGRAR